MNKYTKLIVLIILSLLLLFIFPINLNFVTLPLGIFYFINYFVYLIFWLFPAIKLYKNKSDIKKYIYLGFMYSLVGLLIGLIGNLYGESNNKIQMTEARDTTRFSHYKTVENVILSNTDKKYHNLSNIVLDSSTGHTISDPTTCYYYKFNGQDYIFALKFQSEKYISKFGEVFIFQSNKKMNIPEKIYDDIVTIVNNTCNN